VNGAVKRSDLRGLLESVPEGLAKFKGSKTKERKFENVVKSPEHHKQASGGCRAGGAIFPLGTAARFD
jgi:hypothetical protein